MEREADHPRPARERHHARGIRLHHPARDKAIRRHSRRRGMPIGYVFPKSGTVAIEDGIAVVRGAKHLAAARAYLDFVGSIEMQLAAAREVFRVPARQDLPADSLPEWVRDVRRRMIVADVDWNLVAGHGAEWMRWWDQHVRGTGGGH